MSSSIFRLINGPSYYPDNPRRRRSPAWKKKKHLKSLPITIHASHKRMKKNSFPKFVENDKKELTIMSFETRYLSSVPRTSRIWIYWHKSRKYFVAAGNSHFNNFENWQYRQRRIRKYSENRERLPPRTENIQWKFQILSLTCQVYDVSNRAWEN